MFKKLSFNDSACIAILVIIFIMTCRVLPVTASDKNQISGQPAEWFKSAESRYSIGDVTIHLNGGTDIAKAGDTNIVEFWITNDTELDAMSIAFEFDIGTDYQIIPNYGGLGNYVKEHNDAVGAFDLTGGIMEYQAINNATPDSIGMVGISLMRDLPIHSTSTLCYSMAVYIPAYEPSQTGGFCIDNIYFPPSVPWVFSDFYNDYPPTFQGNPNISINDPDAPPVCFDIEKHADILMGDVNCDCVVNILDVTYTISYLYKGGPPPCSPEDWLNSCGK